MARDPVIPLIARDEDLAALDEALDDAKSGAGRVILLAGEAGTGKTRLAREFIGRAEAKGTAALWGACSEFDLALPFLPFNEAIGMHLANADIAPLREQLGSLTAAVTAVVPQLLDGTSQPDDLSDAGARLRLFEGIVAVLRAVAGGPGSGAVLVVDDVQWADASTRELLDFVARRTRRLPLLLIMTCRTDEVSLAHPLQVILDGWRRAGASTLTMRPFTTSEIGRFIRARLGADRVSHGFVNLVAKRTQGVPAIVEQVLEEAIDSGRVIECGGVWQCSALAKLDLPDSLVVAIRRRLHLLEPEHIPIVTAAAVLGRRFDPAVLPELTGLPADAVSAALQAAADARLLESDMSNRCLRFHSPLTHEAVYRAVPVWEAVDLHNRVADVISRTVPPAPAIERARHLLAANRTADAAPLCAEAAQMASRAGAFAEAATLYEHALVGITDPVERGRLLGGRGHMLMASGAPAAAIAPLQEGVALLGAAADAATPKFLTVLGGTYWLVGNHNSSFGPYEEARVLLEKLPPGPDLAVVYARLAMWHLAKLDCEVGLAWAERALALAERLDAESARALGHIYRGMALCELGRRDEGLAEMDRGNAEAARLLLPEDIGAGAAISAEQRAFAMRAQELAPIAEFLRAADLGPVTEVFASLIEAYAGRYLGDVGQTEVAALAMLNGAESLGNELLAFIGREDLAWVRVQQGRLDEAEALMEDLSPREGMWHRTWGPTRVELAMARADPNGAAAEARALLARVPGVRRDPFVASVVVPALLAAKAEEEAAACVAAALGPDRHPLAVGAAADLAAYRGEAANAAALYTEALKAALAAGYRLIASQYRTRLDEVAEMAHDARPEARSDRAGTLSARERELLALIADGKTDQQIAQTLFLAVGTVRSHLDRIRRKTGRRRRSELTRLAMELSLHEA